MTTATLDTIRDLLYDTQRLLENVLADRPVNPDAIIVVQGLSDIDGSLGIVTAGEFRTGNGHIPGDGFSGVRMAYPAMTYNSELWNIVGVNNDVLQFGLRASDGVAVAGGGVVTIDADGIAIQVADSLVVDPPNAITWITSAGDTVVTAQGWVGTLSTQGFALQSDGSVLGNTTSITFSAHTTNGTDNSVSMVATDSSGHNGNIAIKIVSSASQAVIDAASIEVRTGQTTFFNDIIMTTAQWIGFGAAAGRILFTDAATDTIQLLDANVTITPGSLTVDGLTTLKNVVLADGAYLGLGAAAGRFVFTDAALDTVTLSSASLTVSEYLIVSGSNSGISIQMSRASGNQVGLEFAQTGVGNALLYMPASTNKLIFQSGGDNNLAIDHANRRIGIKNDSPAHTLDVNGDANFEGVLYTNGATLPTSMASGISMKNDTAPSSSPTDQVSIYAGDAAAGKSWLKMRPEDGVARTVVGAESHQGVSTGTGTVKMNGTTARNSVGWLKVHDEAGTIIYLPYWTTVTG
jgi:hypothetical protein